MATDDRLDELLSQHDEVDLESLLEPDSLDIDELLSGDGDELAALLDEVTDGD
jgi:hypothetical protein